MTQFAPKNIVNARSYGASKGVISKQKLSVTRTEAPAATTLSQEHRLVLTTFRLLIADLCQQFNGGHPG